MKVKKQHRKKKYLHKLNRKRINRKQRSTGQVLCKPVKEAWNHKKSAGRNLRDMGLADDPNKVIEIPNFKQQQIKTVKKNIKQLSSDEEEENPPPRIAFKKHIAEELEKEAKAPRDRKLMLPKGQVEFITYLLDKYGHDYKAMEKDKKNYYQETWKQLRNKIKTFMGIPQQYGEYLRERGLLEKEEDEDEVIKQARALVMED